MKKYIHKIIALMIALLLMQSCETELKPIDEVFNNVERGAILRTVEIINPTFDFNNTSSEWIVTLEAQDVQNGKLLSEVKIYSAFINDGSIGSEVFIKSVPATQFSTGPYGFPRSDITVSLQEVLNKSGLKPGDFDSGDSFNIRLESVLSDGRVFTSTNTVGTVTGGSFFSSPFLYSVQFFCALENASVFSGNYVVTADDWADYGEGDVVPVQFVSGYTFRIMASKNPYIENSGTAYMEVTIDPADGSATVNSNECFNYEGWACVDVTGVGTVGTCTGDINLVIDFGGYGGNNFKLVKQ